LKILSEVGVGRTVEHQFAVDHPTAAGHFPGNPIIPGALLLDCVLRSLPSSEKAREIRVAKFLRPVRPGDRVVIRWQPMDNGDEAFECRIADTDQPVFVGTLVWAE